MHNPTTDEVRRHSSNIGQIGRYTSREGFLVSTIKFENQYETAVKHPKYHIYLPKVVQKYKTSQDAMEGHSRWVGFVQNGNLPDVIEIKNLPLVQLIKHIKQSIKGIDHIKVLSSAKNVNTLMFCFWGSNFQETMLYDFKNGQIHNATTMIEQVLNNSYINTNNNEKNKGHSDIITLADQDNTE